MNNHQFLNRSSMNYFANIHFIGIGGSGISALAYEAKMRGRQVTGSDISKNPTIERLEKDGIFVVIGHKTENLPQDTELVIYSEAIDKEQNPEYLEAKNKDIQIMSYFEALGYDSSQKKTIVVTGTHGKTTTTAMLGQILIEAGISPTVIVGARVPYFDDRNVFIGDSDWLVVEGCEYRRNFSTIQPIGMIVLNCELEHVDYFKSEADYVSAFQELAAKIPKDGFLIYNHIDENCRKIASFVTCKKIPISFLEASEINLKIPGDFNTLNAAHALKAGEELGLDKTSILMSLSRFSGTARRMEIKGEAKGVIVIDDYAHHPTEIKATLKALKEKYPERRLVCVFQPHQYSRTYELLEDFKTAFQSADQVIIPNIYEARDTAEDKAKISAESLAKMIPNGIWGEDLEKTVEILKQQTLPGDLLVTMGAGDIYKVGEIFLKN